MKLKAKVNTMKANNLLALGALLLGIQWAAAQSTAIGYQGRLLESGTSANGHYDMRFYLRDALEAGNPVGPTNFFNGPTPVLVSNGLFRVALDFGPGIFTGPVRWLEIGVRTNGSAVEYRTLTPRQALLPVPYAITASNLTGTLPANQLSGTLPSGVLSGANGSGLTSLNASQLASGTMPEARLSANVALRNANQTFSGANNFLGNVGIGTASPQALLNVNGNARIDASSLIPYGEGLILNSPTDLGYGGIHFHNAARGGAIGGGTIKWSMFYSATPENGAGGKGLAFIQNNANTRLYLGTNGNVGIGSTAPRAKLEIQGGANQDGSEDLYALALAHRYGGYRHWISTRHNGDGGPSPGNAFDFYLNTSSSSAGSSSPGVGNAKVMTLDAVNGVRAIGGLVIENRQSDPTNAAPGRIWLIKP